MAALIAFEENIVSTDGSYYDSYVSFGKTCSHIHNSKGEDGSYRKDYSGSDPIM